MLVDTVPHPVQIAAFGHAQAWSRFDAARLARVREKAASVACGPQGCPVDMVPNPF